MGDGRVPRAMSEGSLSEMSYIAEIERLKKQLAIAQASAKNWKYVAEELARRLEEEKAEGEDDA